jgi:hypothetical protein
MRGRAQQEDDARKAENLRRALELTELCLALRCAVVGQHSSSHEALKQVMREIRHTKERGWRRSPS